MLYPSALICDICHKYSFFDDLDRDDGTMVGIICAEGYNCCRGICVNCKENTNPDILEDDYSYICLLCSKNICGVCQKSQFFYHDKCQESIISLLYVYLPDEMCKIIIRLNF